jgi:hypothetical protein
MFFCGTPKDKPIPQTLYIIYINIITLINIQTWFKIVHKIILNFHHIKKVQNQNGRFLSKPRIEQH